VASAQIIDIDRLSQPISEDAPQGSDPRRDRAPGSLYSSIKDARNSARAAERASLFDEDARAGIMAQWRPILQQAPKLLETQAKDLEIACWYLEALVRDSGFGGLRDGIKLIDALVEKFWDGVYPEPDEEDGLETRVAPLTGLNGDGGEGTLLAPLRNLAITAPGSGSGNFDEYTFWQYQQAVETDKLADANARQERANRLGFTLADIRQAVQASPDAFYIELLDDLDATLATYKQLHDRLRQHCGGDAPPSSAISGLLEDIQRSLRFLTKEKLAHLQAKSEPQAAEAQADATPASAGAAPGAVTYAVAAPAVGGGPVASREDALQRLAELAHFFRVTEPHTPLASGIDRLVRWGRMNVAELMAELMPDSTARAIYGQLTGIDVNNPQSSGGNAVVPVAIAAPVVKAAAPVAAPAPTPAATEEDDDLKW